MSFREERRIIRLEENEKQSSLRQTDAPRRGCYELIMNLGVLHRCYYHREKNFKITINESLLRDK